MRRCVQNMEHWEAQARDDHARERRLLRLMTSKEWDARLWRGWRNARIAVIRFFWPPDPNHPF